MNASAPFRIFFALIFATVSVAAVPQPTLFTVLHTFSGYSDGSTPVLPLVMGADNSLYGSTFTGGTNSEGTIFKINRDGTGFSVLHHLSLDEQSQSLLTATPGAYLMMGLDGMLYGTTFGGSTYFGGTAFKLNTDGSGYTLLLSFTNNRPLTLIQGVDGFLYCAGVNGVFKFDTNGGNYSTLHTFNTTNDGYPAYGKLLQASDGFLYGTTKNGGTNGTFGTIFKVDTNNGTGFSVLHTFGAPGDGATSFAGLIEGSDGALYGATQKGGSNAAGTVFKINRDGSGYQILHHFQTNGVDGLSPFGGLVLGLNQLLYGTTVAGGTNNLGTIFRMGLDGGSYEILCHLNTGGGTAPYSGLVQGPASDGSGVMFGAAGNGALGYGTLFAIIVNPPVSITPGVGQSGGHPVVTWPAWAINYQLQTTTNLSGAWQTTSNYIPVTGAQLTNDAPNSYYRLVWPQ